MHSLFLRRGASLIFAASLCSVALGACGDSGGETTTGPTTSSSTGEPLTTTGASSTTATTSEPGTSPTEATSDPTTTTTTGPTTSTDPTTGATTNPTIGDDTTAGTVSTGDTSGSTGDTTTGGELAPCEKDEDCTLVDDCCSCEPVGPGETLECDLGECLISTCSTHDLEGAAVECRFGRCTFVKVTCNPLSITCDKAPPPCAEGDVPSVEENDQGKCWTGFCVPAEACDWVPDCSYCDESELVCVGKLQKGAYRVCEPKPVDCGDSPNIDCGCGQQICDASPPHTVCQDAADDISCECPFC